MAHFARLNENNIVTNVVVISNEDILDSYGQESEAVGIKVCKSIFGNDTRWVQTSYTCSMRKRYAGVGCTYDSVNDVFIPIKPFDSWILNDDFDWIPPVDYPDDGKEYGWNESIINWEEI